MFFERAPVWTPSRTEHTRIFTVGLGVPTRAREVHVNRHQHYCGNKGSENKYTTRNNGVPSLRAPGFIFCLDPLCLINHPFISHQLPQRTRGRNRLWCVRDLNHFEILLCRHFLVGTVHSANDNKWHGIQHRKFTDGYVGYIKSTVFL